MNRHLSSRLLGAALWITALVGASPALADPCTDRPCKIRDVVYQKMKAVTPEQRVQAFIGKHKLTSFASERGVPVVAVPAKLYGDIYSNKLSGASRDYLTKLSPNLVEFSVGSFHHLYTRVGSRSYDNINTLDDDAWRGPGSNDRLAVLVHLTDSEMGRLQRWIDRAQADHDGTLGRFNFNGGDPNSTSPNKTSNCTSWVTNARVGDHGETIGQLVGLYNAGEPYGWVKSLARQGNSRVKAVIVHKPVEGKTFDNGYLAQLFDRYTYRGH